MLLINHKKIKLNRVIIKSSCRYLKEARKILKNINLKKYKLETLNKEVKKYL